MIQVIPNRNKWFLFSGVLTLISLVLLIGYGLKVGIDFTGGTLMEVQFEKAVDQKAVSDALTKAAGESKGGTDLNLASKSVLSLSNQPTSTPKPAALPEETGAVDLGVPLIQPIGPNHYQFRTKYMNNDTHQNVLKEFAAINGNKPVTEQRYETIGPTIGETLKNNAFLAVGLASLFMILYIAFAFRKVPKFLSPFRFGVIAVITLLHDVLITVGVFAFLGAFFGVEVDSLFVTAMLTVMGFSVHDTIVVFDRLRENVRLHPTDDFAKVVNDAVNQTMARSINTSLTTLIMLLVLFILGGVTIKWFVFALLVGITIGTYSSIFTASPLVVVWRPKMVAAQTRGHSIRDRR